MGLLKLFCLQGVWVDEKEIDVVVKYVICQVCLDYWFDVQEVFELFKKKEVDEDIGDDFELLLVVVEFIVLFQFGLMLMLQCKLCVGFVKVGWLMDLFEFWEIVGLFEGLKVCDVFVMVEQLLQVMVKLWGEDVLLVFVLFVVLVVFFVLLLLVQYDLIVVQYEGFFEVEVEGDEDVWGLMGCD